MDALSQILALCQGEVRLDVRCRFFGTFTVPHEPSPPGEAAFHLVLDGRCRLLSATGKIEELSPGSFVLLPQGQAHAVIDALSSAAIASPVTTMHVEAGHTLPVKYGGRPSNKAGDGDHEHTQRSVAGDVDLLCGRLLYAQNATALLMRSLPPVIQVCLAQSPGVAPLKAMTQLLRSEVNCPQPGALSIANALAQALLTYALRAYGQSSPMQAAWLTLVSHERLSASMRAMITEPQRAWTVEQLGKLSALSRASYARIFKEQSGWTPGEALTTIRLMHACNLMQQSQCNIADIAQAVGYQSEAAFGKIFRRELGSTPGQWRKARRASTPSAPSLPDSPATPSDYGS